MHALLLSNQQRLRYGVIFFSVHLMVFFLSRSCSNVCYCFFSLSSSSFVPHQPYCSRLFLCCRCCVYAFFYLAFVIMYNVVEVESTYGMLNAGWLHISLSVCLSVGLCDCICVLLSTDYVC